VLWILASVAFALLCYEIPTLITGVLWPLWNNPNALQTDFHYYYEAAQRFSADPSRLYLASDDVIAGFAYPPPAIVPFVVLSKMPLGAALLLLTLTSFAAILVATRLWITYLRRQGMAIALSTEIAVTLVAIALGPSYMNIMIGQVNALVLVTSVVFVSFAPLIPQIAAVMLASGIWLKVYPVALGAIGTWDRRAWRALAWTIVSAIVIAMVLLPIVPPAAYQAFFFEVLPSRIDKTAIHITNQSLVAFLERFGYPAQQFLNWTGEQAVTVSLAVRMINLVFAAAAVALFWMRARSSQAASAAGLMAMIAVIAPLGWGHSYVMVLPLIILQLIAMKTAHPVAAIAIFLSVAAFMIPAGRHVPIDWAPGWIQNLVYSRYLLAAVTLSVLPIDTRYRRA
jgi:alpha-1,2-mannosyltransferase